MKRLVSTFLLLFLVLAAAGQIGNEWIAYHQPYVRIPVGEDGLFKVSYAALQQAGFPVSADPRKFQLYHRGKEQTILVTGENDGTFTANDFIEFYGRKNDGTLDSTLYEDPSHQPHKYYNLYSDTTSYFLTIGSVNGKRMSLYSGTSAGLAEGSFVWAERLLVLKNNYSSGMEYGKVQKSTFDAGEGWTGVQIAQGQETTYVIEDITEISTASGKPLLEIALTGRGLMPHKVDLYAGARLISTVSFSGYETYTHLVNLEWSDVDGAGKLAIKVRVNGSSGPDRISVGYVRLAFPRNVTMSGRSEILMGLEGQEAGPVLLKIKSAASGTRIFDITDPSTLIQIQGQAGATLDIVVPRTTIRQKLLATTRVKEASGIKRVSFRQIDPTASDYIIITHSSLRKAAEGYVDPVKAYAEYRSLPEGGGFDTLVVNIDQIYDQFNYGEPSPRAIFQFMKFMASGKLPEYLFLVGKGLDVNYGYRRNAAAFTSYKDLVPTAGYPASDMAFTAGAGGTPYAHTVATGRLSANTPAQVAVYLNKIKERDALPFNDLNRKKILHLSGGIEEDEPARFRDILRGFETVAENYYLGGDVKAIVKRSTDIKLINIAEEVNAGLGLITFFGHSAPNTLDFDIGLVTDPVMGYNNKGKYPFMLMNGCDAGSFFLNTTIPGENWISTAHKGAVGFIAHSSFGLVSALQRYSSLFYDVAFGDSVFIEKGVGAVQREVARRYVSAFGTSPLDVSQIQQMVLLGDPAVRIFGATKPDLALQADKISIVAYTDEPVTALTDSFRIHIPITNTGIALDEKIRAHIRREFNEGQVIEYDTIFPAVLHADTVSILIRNPARTGYGINTFTIYIDADDLVAELDETNNTASFEYFIPANSTRNVFPYNYSIVNDRDVSLAFQYTDPLSNSREYLLEIDTTNTFDSGYRQQFTISAKVLGRQPVTLMERDSLVYYWRTKIKDPLADESTTWATSSFTYIGEGPEGWAQMHFLQFESNAMNGLVIDPGLRRIKFEETVSDIAVRTFPASAGKPQDSISFKINGAEFNLLYEGGACRNNTINLVAFDRRSTQPYAGLYFKWYEPGRRLLCGREPYVINSFTPAELLTGNQDDLIQYVDNIAPGDSVVLFNIGDAGFDQWPEGAKAKLSELGISGQQIANLHNGDAAVIFARKGAAPGTAVVHVASEPSASVVIKRTIAGRFTSGTMVSRLIGPAQNWKRFYYSVKEVEAQDRFTFAVIGINGEGVSDTLQTNLVFGADLSFIDAAEFPFIQIAFDAQDDINLTAVQLPEWLVSYEPVAEGLIFYNGSRTSETVAEGKSVARDFGFVNVSNKAFSDSLTVRYSLINPLQPATAESLKKISPPTPNDTTYFTVEFETVSKGGVNDVRVFVNPRVIPEQSYDNNIIGLPEHVQVTPDEHDPVMEVTFDGRFLQNNDYVTTNPSILIRLRDENEYLLKKDTADVRIFLAHGCDSDECDFQSVYFSRNDITWEPATATSDFQVRFTPTLVSGNYILKVQVRDATGNPRDEGFYEISFKVSEEQSIAVSAAYPNPFFAETNIDIVVSGDQSYYSSFRFNVTSVNGEIVAEFGADTGLRVGQNKLRWDGSGRDGRVLPNGLYFYQLVIPENGVEKRYAGKIVLSR